MSHQHDPDVQRSWQHLHRVVNMSSPQLRGFLLTEASGERAFLATPSLDLPELSRSLLHVLNKRKVDLTPADVVVMDRVVAAIDDLLARRPPAGGADDGWRHSLMTLGHDPLTPGAAETGDEEAGAG